MKIKSSHFYLIILFIICISLFCFYLINPSIPPKESMICSPSSENCIFVVTDNGGATTSFYNRIYSYNVKTQTKKFVFAVDKASSSQIRIEWISSEKLSVIVPSCSLVERKSNVSDFTIDFMEDGATSTIRCSL